MINFFNTTTISRDLIGAETDRGTIIDLFEGTDNERSWVRFDNGITFYPSYRMHGFSYSSWEEYDF